jgi:Capsular polysaccharide synthesis protein
MPAFFSPKSLRFRLRKWLPAPVNIKVPPAVPRQLMLGSSIEASACSPLPNIVWTYWEGAPSRVVQACIESWHCYNKDVKIIKLSEKNLTDFLPDFPLLDQGVRHQHKSDLIRLMLLERYGGVWLDASTLLCENIRWIFSALDNKSEALLFFNQNRHEYRIDYKQPILENGFIAARANSSFIKAWRKIYQEWLLAPNYQAYFFSDPDFKNISKNFINQTPTYLSYFICYIAAQKALRTTENICLICMNSEDDFYYHYYDTKKSMDKLEFAKRLLLTAETKLPRTKIIKIAGGHRHKLEQFIEYDCFKVNSLLGKFL